MSFTDFYTLSCDYATLYLQDLLAVLLLMPLAPDHKQQPLHYYTLYQYVHIFSLQTQRHLKQLPV